MSQARIARLLNFEPAVKQLTDYFNNIKNKAALLEKINYLKSGIWGYFFRSAFANYVEFENSLTKASNILLIQEALVKFYESDKKNGNIFLKEITLQLFPADSKYVNQDDIFDQMINEFITATKMQIKIYRQELENMQKELTLLEEKRKQEYAERKKTLTATGSVTSRLASIRSELTKAESQRRYHVTAKPLSTNNELSNAQDALAEHFNAKVTKTFKLKLNPRSTALSLEEMKLEGGLRANLHSLNKKKKEAGSANLKIFEHGPSSPEKKLSSIEPEQQYPDPFHRRPM